eukprot:2679476-Amphidinium_carterae.2
MIVDDQVADCLRSVAETLEKNENLSVDDVASLAKSIDNGAKDVSQLSTQQALDRGPTYRPPATRTKCILDH